MQPSRAGRCGAAIVLAASAAGTSVAVWAGTANAVDTPIEISANAIVFDPADVGTTQSRSIQVTNTGGSPFGPINMFGGAPPTAEFNASQNCQAQTLAPGASCQIDYSFTPSAAGTFADSSNFTISPTSSQSDGEDFAVSLSGVGVDPTATTTSTTSTSTTSSTSSAPTTTDPGSTTAAPETSAPPPSAAPTPPTGVAVPGPVVDGDALVVAQGVVEFPSGSYAWRRDLIGAAGWPLQLDGVGPSLLVADGAGPLLVTADGRSLALVDRHEATFLPIGLVARADPLDPSLSGQTSAFRLTFEASDDVGAFVPGEGPRDVNLVAALLQPSESVTVASEFPVIVVVGEGAVSAGQFTLAAGQSTVSGPTLTATAIGDAPALVYVGAVGGRVP